MFSVWGVGFTVWELGGFELVGAMGFCSLSLLFSNSCAARRVVKLTPSAAAQCPGLGA